MYFTHLFDEMQITDMQFKHIAKVWLITRTTAFIFLVFSQLMVVGPLLDADL